MCYLISKYLYPVVKDLEMNQVCSSEALPHKRDMRYKLRIVSVHTGQGRGFKEQETKKKGRKRGRKDEAHYYGYLCNFVSSKWYKLDDNDVDDVEENDMLLDVRDKADMFTTFAMDQRSEIFATRRINLYFLLSRYIIQHYHKVKIMLLHQIPLIKKQ